MERQKYGVGAFVSQANRVVDRFGSGDGIDIRQLRDLRCRSVFVWSERGNEHIDHVHARIFQIH